MPRLGDHRPCLGDLHFDRVEPGGIGLGRFGRSLALELMAGGTEVLGVDTVDDNVQSLNGRLTQVVRADPTKTEVLRQPSAFFAQWAAET